MIQCSYEVCQTPEDVAPLPPSGVPRDSIPHILCSSQSVKDSSYSVFLAKSSSFGSQF